jgi:TRAP-type C4-dicarboxylate transport system substrate-binding protein
MTNFDALKAMGLIFLGILPLVTAVDAAADTTVIKIATLAPEGSAWIQTLNELNAEVMKKTENSVQFKIYPGGVLGDERDMVRKMFIGQVQGAVLTSSGLSGIFGEMDVFQIPFLFENYEEIDDVVEKMDAFFRKGFEEKGYVMLAWSEGGFVYLMSTVPASTMAELKKAKVWTWEDAPMAKVIFDAAGISAIPLSVPDVLVGLQTGLVDVVYAPPTGAISMQWFTKIKYINDVPLIYLIGAVIIKKTVFEKLSPAHQKVVLDSFTRQMAQLKLEIREQNQEALKVMTQHGARLIKPSQEQIDEFKKVTDNAMQHMGDMSFSKKVRDEVTAYVEEYRQRKK